MLCEEKVKSWRSVEAQKIPEEKAAKTSIRWLLGPQEVPNFYMRLFEVEPGGEIFEHSHSWEHEIFILQGKALIRIGGREYKVKEGDVIYIPPCKKHYYKNVGNDTLRFLCLIPKEGK